MATNRPDTLDPALVRPGRLDRKVEFSLPDMEGRAHIFKIHARSMSVEKDIRYELLARLCPNSTGMYKESLRQLLLPRNEGSGKLKFLDLLGVVHFKCMEMIKSAFLGAEIRSVCTEAGMFAIRARRKMATEKDFLEAINKVIKAYAKFSATPRYMTYN